MRRFFITSGNVTSRARHRLDADRPLDPRAVLTSIGTVVYDWDIASDRLDWGPNLRDVFGFDRRRRLTTGKSFEALVEPGSGEGRQETVLTSPEQDLGTGVPYRAHYALRTRSRRLFLVEDSGRWFAGPDGRPAFAHGALRVQPAGCRPGDDGFPRGRGVPDRDALLARLTALLHLPDQPRRPLALMVAAVEPAACGPDNIGPACAEPVIDAVGSRLARSVRRRDLVLRLGGSRFCIVLAACPGDQLADAARHFAQAVEAPPRPASPVAGVRLRFGAVAIPERVRDAKALLERAEEALDEARLADRRIVAKPARLRRRYSPRTRVASEPDLLGALNGRQVSLATGTIVEAAGRRLAIRDLRAAVPGSTDGAAASRALAPAAERLGLALLIDQRALDLAMQRLAADEAPRLLLHVSGETLRDPYWLTALSAHLGAHPGTAHRLLLGVPEAAVAAAAGLSALSIMKALGVGLVLTGAGAGHLTPDQLWELPFDMLAIDAALVQNLPRSADDRFLVRSIIESGHRLGLAVVADGVDALQSATLLTGWGADYLGGPAVEPQVREDVPPALDRAAGFG